MFSEEKIYWKKHMFFVIVFKILKKYSTPHRSLTRLLKFFGFPAINDSRQWTNSPS